MQLDTAPPHFHSRDAICNFFVTDCRSQISSFMLVDEGQNVATRKLKFLCKKVKNQNDTILIQFLCIRITKANLQA